MLLKRKGQDHTSITEQTSTPPPLPRRQVMITMAAVMAAMFLSSLDQTIVGTAMPKIISDLGGFTRYTWVTTAYMIASTITLPITGKLTDLYGRKWIYVAGLTIFLLGSILSGLSQSMTQLIAFRGFQGIGGGIMMANAFIIIGDLFAPLERGKYQGFMTGVFGLSSVIGPTLGGFITDNWGWHWVFLINVPLGLVILVLFMAFLPNIAPNKSGRGLDYAGIITLSVAVLCAMLAFSWAGVDYPWGSARIIGMFAVAALLIIVFVYIESRSREPIIPLWIFSNRIVSVSVLVMFSTGFGMFGGIIFIPLFFQGVLGESATASGNLLMPMMLGLVCGSLISGQLLSRTGGHYRRQGLAGLGIMALGMFLLSTMTVATDYAEAILYIIVAGFGLGVTLPLYTIAIQNAVPYSVMGVATSSTAFFRSIGGALGLAVFGSIMNNRFSSEFLSEISPQVKEVLSPAQLDDLAHNPEVLLDADALDQLRQTFEQSGTGGLGLIDQLMETLREALSSGITQVFLIGLVIVLVAWVGNLFLKEIPLRSKHV